MLKLNHHEAILFSDGSSRGNPGPAGWGAVAISGETVVELGGAVPYATNNAMELGAIFEALKFLKSEFPSVKKIEAYLDSRFVVQGITEWVPRWRRNGWKTSVKEDVVHKMMWESLDELAVHFSIHWHTLSGHVGIVGNERCDEIAGAFANGMRVVELYRGPLSRYGKNILDLSAAFGESERKSTRKEHSKAKAYSYVSEVGGIVKTHATWAECEKRVKGVPAARFKKVFSVDEERALAHKWGSQSEK